MRTLLRVVRKGKPSKLQIQTSGQVFELLRPHLRGLDREHVWRIDLDSRNRVIARELIAIGSLNASVIEPREVFKGAFLNNAASIILAHNHPSQNSRPSDNDKDLTKRLLMVGIVLGVELFDHVVMTDTNWYSFREAGQLGFD